jgi:hypothetical protein
VITMAQALTPEEALAAQALEAERREAAYEAWLDGDVRRLARLV